MSKLNRPYSVEFNIKDFRGSKLSNHEVLQAVSSTVPKGDIRGVQLTLQGCIITLKNSDSHDKLKAEGFSLRTRHISVTDVDQSITNVTLKDAPVEMNDLCLKAALQPYGDIISNSIKRGKIKNSEVETGTRYLRMLNVEDPIPGEIQVGRFTIRVFCDNGKTECIYCKSTDHQSYQCPNKSKPTAPAKVCFRCKGTDHLIADCPNPIACDYCGMSA